MALPWNYELTQWAPGTQYDTWLSSSHQDILATIDTGNGLVPAQHQAITKINADLLSIAPWEINYGELWSKIILSR